MPKFIKLSAAKFGIRAGLCIPESLLVIEHLQQHGYSAYIVGGAVRDLLLAKTPKDYDVVTDAHPAAIKRIFKSAALIIGRRFKIVHVYAHKLMHSPAKCIIEVATYRAAHDSLNEHGRILADNNFGTINEDAQKRDFTLNALYYDPTAEIIIDFHNGIQALQSKELRSIGKAYKRFLEDPVRILRAIRLSQKLELILDRSIIKAIAAAKQLLLNESMGRLFEEMAKILLSGSASKIIVQLQALHLPVQLFKLFAVLFYDQHSTLADAVIANTDARIAAGETVSLIYIMAALLLPYSDELVRQCTNISARIDILTTDHTICRKFAVPRNIYLNLCDIWILEYKLMHIAQTAPDELALHITHLSTQKRVRQALHLLHLRADFNLLNPTILATVNAQLLNFAPQLLL